MSKNNVVSIDELLSQLPDEEGSGVQLNWLQIMNSRDPDQIQWFGKFRLRTPLEIQYFDAPIQLFVLKERYRFLRQEPDRVIYLTTIFDRKTKPLKRDGQIFTFEEYDKDKEIFQTLLFAVMFDINKNLYLPCVFPLKKSALHSLYVFKKEQGLKSVAKKFIRVNVKLEQTKAVKYYVPIFELIDASKLKTVPIEFLNVVNQYLLQIDEYIEGFNAMFTQPNNTIPEAVFNVNTEEEETEEEDLEEAIPF